MLDRTTGHRQPWSPGGLERQLAGREELPVGAALLTAPGRNRTPVNAFDASSPPRAVGPPIFRPT